MKAIIAGGGIGGLTTALNSHFSNYFNVIDGTNGRTLVGNLA